MAEPTVPPVTDAAVDAALQWARTAPTVSRRDHFRRMLEAAAPHMVPAPALPTEPGAVVLASRIRGHVFDPAVLAVRAPDGHMGTWMTPGIRLPGPGHGAPTMWFHVPDITEWTPASVVPDDEHGPVAVLRHLAEQLKDRSREDLQDAVNDALIVIGACLDRLDGDL
jgi:hypothetical protein